MRKTVLAALAATLCVALPIQLIGTLGTVLGLSGDASAAKRPGTVTVDLALIADGGTAVVTAWIRSSGNVDEFASHISADHQIDIAGFLTQSDWEFVSRELSASGTAAGIASSIVADFKDRKGPPPDDFAIILGSSGESGSVPLTIGQLLVAQDSPGVYSSVAYIDFASGFASGGAASAESSTPLPGPAAASSGGTPSSRYLVWPEVAKLGETVAILLETQSEVDLYPDGALLNPTPENFAVGLTDLADPGAGTEFITPRAVIEAPAALGSLLVGLQSESWTGIVLVFDLPDPLGTLPSPTFPAEFEVRVDYESYTVFDGKTLDVIATGGTPLADSDVESLRELGLHPMLRLRPSWESGIGFNPIWEIGAVEFTLRYQKPATGDIANLSALANGDAIAAPALAAELTAPSGQKAWRISLVDPEGFSIPDKGCIAPGDCYAGRWSMLDLRLDKIPEGLSEGTPIFNPGDFTIEDLRVIDVDGAQLNSTYAGETFFNIHAVDNLVDPTGAPSPTAVTIWPKRAYAGDTVAVLFNSEADVDANSDAALLDASVENVVVRVTDPDGHTESVTPRAVIEAPAALGSDKVGTPPASQTGVIAFFDVPDPWPNPSPSYSLPGDFDVAVDYEGAPTLGTNEVRVIGTGGVPTDFTPVAPLGHLTLGPMLRLRPSWDPTAGPPIGFDPTWEIGAVEFELRYTQSGVGEVSNVVALGNGEAVSSLVMATALPDEGADKLWRISLVEPAGLTIPHKGCVVPGDCYSGRWALVDLLLETQANGLQPGEPIFFASEFSIEAVKVYDRGGVQHNPPYAGETFFQMDVVNVPEPSATVQLITGLVGVWALGWWRRRGVARLG